MHPHKNLPTLPSVGDPNQGRSNRTAADLVQLDLEFCLDRTVELQVRVGAFEEALRLLVRQVVPYAS